MYANRIKRATEALGFTVPKNFRSKLIKITAATVTIASVGLQTGLANAATLSSASVALSDPRPSQTLVNYTFTGSSVQTVLTKCIKLVFSTTSAGTTPPTGFDSTVAGVAVNAATNYVPTPASLTLTKSTNGTITLTSAAGQTPASATGRTISIDGITNSSVADTSYFLTVTTYSNTDCATGPLDNSLVKFINTNGSTLTLSVDPTLTFTVNSVASGATCNGATATVTTSSTSIPFGPVTTAANQIGCQDLTAATNATNGYTVYTRYTAKPTNLLSQTIADWTGTNAAPTAFPSAGTEAYGYTTNATALGTGTPGRFTGGNWAAETTSNAEVGYSATGVTNTTYRIGHQVGVSLTTKPGNYTTTIIYTCTPIY